MKARLSKRFLAYIIDIILIGLMLVIVDTKLVNQEKIIQLNKELNEINEKMLNDEVEISELFKEYALVTKQIDLERVMFNVVVIIVIIIYFVFAPYYNNGQTIGAKLMNIRIVTKDGSRLTINKLMIRNLIINGLGYLTIGMAFLYVFSGLTYFILMSILSFIQFALIIVSIFMISYRKDQCGIHDIISRTKIIEIDWE